MLYIFIIISVNADCDDGWVSLNSGRYMFICEKEVYSDAHAVCNDHGGALVAINNKKESVSVIYFYILNSFRMLIQNCTLVLQISYS